MKFNHKFLLREIQTQLRENLNLYIGRSLNNQTKLELSIAIKYTLDKFIQEYPFAFPPELTTKEITVDQDNQLITIIWPEKWQDWFKEINK